MHTSSQLNRSLVAMSLALLGMSAQATVVTFDDLHPGEGGYLVTNPYQGLTWNNWYSVDACSALHNSGYCAGTVSGSIVGFNGYGNAASFSASSNFTLNSLYLTSAWNDGLKVTFTGSSGGSALFSKQVMPTADSPMLVTFDWAGIDTVQMVTAGGTPHLLYGALSGGHVAVDNITFNVATAVPEPGTNAMMLVGLGALGLIGRRRRAG